jgi:uncharacterized protein YwgA
VNDVFLAAFVKLIGESHLAIAGRKAFQKLLYFAQIRGWPTEFDYRLHLFGPFSDDAATALDILEEEGVVRVDQSGEIKSGNHIDEVVGTIEVSPEAAEAITQVAADFRNEDSRSLELLATILFIWEAERRVHGQAVEYQVIRKVRKYKGEKFTAAEVEAGLGKLKELGYAA